MKVVDQPLRDELAEVVQKALDHHQPRRYRVFVDKNAILEDDGWFHVVVVTDKDVRDRDFYDALVEAEAELNDDDDSESDNVNKKKKFNQFLLVPAIGD